MIFLIGDSHTRSFSNEFTKIPLNAPTAYQNIKRIPEIDNELLKNNFNKDSDKIVFSFGEIDIRCHLGAIAEKAGRTVDDVVSECVNRYGVFLDYYIEKNYTIEVYGPIPSGHNNSKQGNSMPSWGDVDRRNEITALFTEKLKIVCNSKSIPFWSVYDRIINDKANYKKYYAIDDIHLNSGEFKNNEYGYDCRKLLKDTLGLKITVGKDVILDSDIFVKHPELVKIENHVAIDKGFYCTTALTIGNYVHISPYVTCIGGSGSSLTLKGFNNIMAGAKIICVSDRFDSSGLFGALIPQALKGTQIVAPIVIEEFANVGSNAIVMPGSILRKGVLLCAGSLLMGDTEEWGVYRGNPAQLVKKIDPTGILENAKKLGYSE